MKPISTQICLLEHENSNIPPPLPSKEALVTTLTQSRVLIGRDQCFGSGRLKTEIIE